LTKPYDARTQSASFGWLTLFQDDL